MTTFSSRRGLRAPALVSLAAACSLLVVAACGSDSGGSDDNSSPSDAPAADVSALKAKVAEYAKEPTEISVKTPLSKKPDPGKTIAYMKCGFPACQPQADGVKEGAEALGWTVRMFPYEGTIQSIQQAWTQAIRFKPDAIITAGTGKEAFGPQLAQAEKAGIPVVQSGTADDKGGGLTASQWGGDVWEEQGQIEADWTIADSDGKANTLFTNATDVPVDARVYDGIKKSYDQCSGCKLDKLDTTISALGQDMVNQVVNYVKTHRDITYIIPGFNDMAAGLPQGLAAAGIKDIKMITTGFNSTVSGLIENDQMYGALVGASTTEAGYLNIDFLARYFNGDPTDESEKAGMPKWIVTKEFASQFKDPDFPSTVGGYQDQYKKLWGVA